MGHNQMMLLYLAVGTQEQELSQLRFQFEVCDVCLCRQVKIERLKTCFAMLKYTSKAPARLQDLKRFTVSQTQMTLKSLTENIITPLNYIHMSKYNLGLFKNSQHFFFLFQSTAVQFYKHSAEI